MKAPASMNPKKDKKRRNLQSDNPYNKDKFRISQVNLVSQVQQPIGANTISNLNFLYNNGPNKRI